MLKRIFKSEQEVEAAMLTRDQINQIRSYGSLGYSIDRISDLLSLSKAQRLLLSIRINMPGDEVSEAYASGVAIGEFNIDVELAKKSERGDINSITLLTERKKERVEIDLRKKLFGV